MDVPFFLFPTTLRSQAFTGTSAAAPQAAGLAAVLWSRHPSWSAEEVHTALMKSALDVGPPRLDSETGFGMIRLPGSRMDETKGQSDEKSSYWVSFPRSPV